MHVSTYSMNELMEESMVGVGGVVGSGLEMCWPVTEVFWGERTLSANKDIFHQRCFRSGLT